MISKSSKFILCTLVLLTLPIDTVKAISKNFNYYVNPVEVFTYNKVEEPMHIPAKPIVTPEALINYASNFLGTPYMWGGETPSGFDAAGFVKYVYAHFDIQLPRTTKEQVKVGVKISDKARLLPGDLVFFGKSSIYPNHVGIYIGNNTYIHSPQTGDVVKFSTLSSRNDFLFGRRIIGTDVLK